MRTYTTIIQYVHVYELNQALYAITTGNGFANIVQVIRTSDFTPDNRAEYLIIYQSNV
jgi:hypothetical protein